MPNLKVDGVELEVPDGISVLRACSVDIERLQSDLTRFVDEDGHIRRVAASPVTSAATVCLPGGASIHVVAFPVEEGGESIHG